MEAVNQTPNGQGKKDPRHDKTRSITVIRDHKGMTPSINLPSNQISVNARVEEILSKNNVHK